ncbi:hypothetical protein D9M68_758700 [compost metagenome]
MVSRKGLLLRAPRETFSFCSSRALRLSMWEVSTGSVTMRVAGATLLPSPLSTYFSTPSNTLIWISSSLSFTSLSFTFSRKRLDSALRSVMPAELLYCSTSFSTSESSPVTSFSLSSIKRRVLVASRFLYSRAEKVYTSSSLASTALPLSGTALKYLIESTVLFLLARSTEISLFSPSITPSRELKRSLTGRPCSATPGFRNTRNSP